MKVRMRPQKHYCFRIAFWIDFEALGVWFWLILEPPEPFFWFRTAIAFGETREAFQVEGLTLMIRAWIFGGFWKDFWRFLEGFGEQTMIRATEGKSTDRWMDGWMDPWMIRIFCHCVSWPDRALKGGVQSWTPRGGLQTSLQAVPNGAFQNKANKLRLMMIMHNEFGWGSKANCPRFSKP